MKIKNKITPITVCKNKTYTTDYYEDLKAKNKEREEKEKNKVRNICAIIILCTIVLIAICV